MHDPPGFAAASAGGSPTQIVRGQRKTLRHNMDWALICGNKKTPKKNQIVKRF